MKNTAGRVLVFARSRPLLDREANDVPAVEMDTEGDNVMVRSTPDALSLLKEGEKIQLDRKEKAFQLDGVFGEDDNQKAVFQRVALPVLVEVMKGFNGCIFAYGQTGSGKTHSLLNSEVTDMEQVGILPRLVATLYARAAMDKANVYQINAAGFQVYNEQVDDLLHPEFKKGKGQNLTVGNGGSIPTLTWVECESPQAMLEFFKRARSGLHYAETKMNKSSSRSHAVFQISIVRRRRAKQEHASRKMEATVGQLSVVDLAGSERVKRSGVTGSNFKEATNINGSLLALGNVIQALADKRKHVPFRDSKLTRILEGSVGGNCKTSLLVCVSPSENSVSETLSTLEFASRAMCVEVNATVNETVVEIDAARLAADMEEATGAQYVDEEMMKTFKESEQALASARARVVEHEKKAKSLELQLDKMGNELQMKQRNIVETEEVNKKQSSLIETLQAELQESEKKHIAAMKKSNGIQEELQTKLSSAEESLQATRETLAEISRRHVEERETKENLQRELRELENKVFASEAESSQALSLARSERDQLRSALNQEIESKATERINLEREIAQNKAKAQALEKSLSTLNEEKEGITKILAEMTSKVSSLTQLLSIEQEKVEKLMVIQHEAASLQVELDSFKQKTSDLEGELTFANERNDALGKKFSALQEEHDCLANSHANEVSIKSELTKKKEDLEQELIDAERHVAENKKQLKETEAKYDEEVQALKANYEEFMRNLRRQSVQESEKQAQHAAEAMEALELRAQREQEKMIEKIGQIRTELEVQANEHANELKELNSRFAKELGDTLQKERMRHSSEVDRLRNQIQQGIQRLVKAEQDEREREQELGREHELKILRAHTAHYAARKAGEKAAERLQRKFGQLHTRFEGRESRPEDLQRIAAQQRELNEMKRAVKNAKRITQQKQLELKHVMDNVRIFGTEHDIPTAETSPQKILPGQKYGEKANFQTRQKSRTPTRGNLIPSISGSGANRPNTSVGIRSQPNLHSPGFASPEPLEGFSYEEKMDFPSVDPKRSLPTSF